MKIKITLKRPSLCGTVEEAIRTSDVLHIPRKPRSSRKVNVRVKKPNNINSEAEALIRNQKIANLKYSRDYSFLDNGEPVVRKSPAPPLPLLQLNNKDKEREIKEVQQIYKEIQIKDRHVDQIFKDTQVQELELEQKLCDHYRYYRDYKKRSRKSSSSKKQDKMMKAPANDLDLPWIKERFEVQKMFKEIQFMDRQVEKMFEDAQIEERQLQANLASMIHKLRRDGFKQIWHRSRHVSSERVFGAPRAFTHLH